MERKTLKDLLNDMTEKTKDITPMKLDVEKLDIFFATKNCLQSLFKDSNKVSVNSVTPWKTNPTGSLMLSFDGIDLEYENKELFCKILNAADGFCIQPQNGKITVVISFENIWIKE